MKRRTFIKIAGGSVASGAAAFYFGTDTRNMVRDDVRNIEHSNVVLNNDEQKILYLASLAPSGHNTQPWFVKYVEPYKWIVCNDKSRWLPSVDPLQRETILSIGAFLQNVEYAANSVGYSCQFETVATQNQDEDICAIALRKAPSSSKYDIEKIEQRRTIRSNFLSSKLKEADVRYLLDAEKDFISYIPNSSKEHVWLNEQTIAANKIQAYRDDAQNELARWIRFSSKEAERYKDGLTTATMEINGVQGWYLRNFYSQKDVTKKDFRDQSVEKVVSQVSQSAGWFIVSSKDSSVAQLLSTGMRLQRMWLHAKDKSIAIHPMTQIIEETTIQEGLNKAMGITDPIQFILRTGYVASYPAPVSLRRSVDLFVKANS